MNPDFTQLVYLCLALTVVVGAALLLRAYLSEKHARQMNGMARVQAMREMVYHLQLHRASTSLALSSKRGDEDSILQSRAAVDKVIRRLSTYQPEIEFDIAWQNITQHWAKLSVGFESNTVENNLTQHNRLIQNCLNMVDETVDRFHLEEINRVELKMLNLWKQLLATVESIGQARALGMLIISGDKESIKLKARLQFLPQQIKRGFESLERQVELEEETCSLRDQLLESIERGLLGASLDVSEESYYVLCSRLMDSLYRYYDDSLKVVSRDSPTEIPWKLSLHHS